MTNFVYSEKTLALMTEAANNYKRIIDELNEKEKSEAGLNPAEIRLQRDVSALRESHLTFTIEMMVESNYTWARIADLLNLSLYQTQNLMNWCMSSDKKHLISTKLPQRQIAKPFKQIDDALKQLDDVGVKVAAAIDFAKEYHSNLEVYEDTEEVANALAGIYNDASLDDRVDKYALGEAITHLRGLYETAVDFSTKMNDILKIDTESEDEPES